MKTHIEFWNGAKMPIIGYGMWQSENPKDLETGLDRALEAGYRHFDTAFAYGNEEIFGNALQRWFKTGLVKREDLFIVTKLPIHGGHHDRVEKYLVESLRRLKLEYVDLYLVHNPAVLKDDGWNIAFNEKGEVTPDLTTTLEQLWKAMEAQVTTGRTKSIGISNFSIPQVERIVKCAAIMPTNHQVELNANYPKHSLRSLCLKHGITICAFAPLGSPGRKTYYEEANNPRFANVKIPSLLEDPIVIGVAKKHNKTAAQVLLRFLAQQCIVVIPKSVTPSRIKENINIFDFELDASDMLQLDSLKINDEGTWGFDWSSSLPGLTSHPEFQLTIGHK